MEWRCNEVVRYVRLDSIADVTKLYGRNFSDHRQIDLPERYVHIDAFGGRVMVRIMNENDPIPVPRSNQFCIVSKDSGFDIEYLYILFCTIGFRDSILYSRERRLRRQIKVEDLGRLQIPEIPPYDQKRIVEKYLPSIIDSNIDTNALYYDINGSFRGGHQVDDTLSYRISAEIAEGAS